MFNNFRIKKRKKKFLVSITLFIYISFTLQVLRRGRSQPDCVVFLLACYTTCCPPTELISSLMGKIVAQLLKSCGCGSWSTHTHEISLTREDTIWHPLGTGKLPAGNHLAFSSLKAVKVKCSSALDRLKEVRKLPLNFQVCTFTKTDTKSSSHHRSLQILQNLFYILEKGSQTPVLKGPPACHVFRFTLKF